MARRHGAALATALATAAAAGALLLADAAITEDDARRGSAEPAALAAFARVASVLESPRCGNCHPRGDRPSQGPTPGGDRHVHLMNVQRGPADRGLPAMGCPACHQGRNNDRAGVPGAPHWRLAPRSMGWTGLSRAELCRTLLDRSKNGGRSPEALLKHMTGDALVLWAWHPGARREPPPVSADDFKRALEVWVSAGTPCPQ
jgi:hypothetical protein